MMSVTALMVAFTVFTVYLLVYPPGFTFTYEVPYMTLKVPEALVAKGYPREIRVSYDYMYGRYGLDYGRLVNDTFRSDGVYDYVRGRVITPEEAERGLGPLEALSPVKIGLFTLFIALVATAFTIGSQTIPGNGRYSRDSGGFV